MIRYRLLLPKLLAWVTGTPRSLPEFQWSTSWVYNAFRVYEMVFFRKEGIRLEQISDTSDGVVLSFTLENYLATWEGVLRAFLRNWAPFRVVVLTPAQVSGHSLTPYRFAIAFDAATDLQPTTPGGSNSGNHTVTGANPILFGMGWGPITDLNGITAMTYNSVAMTIMDKNGDNGVNRWSYSYVLMAPATGTNSLAYTAVASDAADVVAVSYSGAAQTGQPDAHNIQKASAVTSRNCAITVVAANCWIVAFGYNDQGAATFTGTNRKNLGSNTARPVNDSNGTVATGSNTYTESWTGSGFGQVVMASFAPAASAAVSTNLSVLNAGS